MLGFDQCYIISRHSGILKFSKPWWTGPMRNTTIKCLKIISEDSMVLWLRVLSIMSTADCVASMVSIRMIDWDFLHLQVLAAGKEYEDDLSLRNELSLEMVTARVFTKLFLWFRCCIGPVQSRAGRETWCNTSRRTGETSQEVTHPVSAPREYSLNYGVLIHGPPLKGLANRCKILRH